MSREKGRMAVATKAPWIEWVSRWSLIWEKRSRLPLLRQVPVDNIDNSLWFNCVKACDSSALSEQSQALLIWAEASQQESINSQQNSRFWPFWKVTWITVEKCKTRKTRFWDERFKKGNNLWRSAYPAQLCSAEVFPNRSEWRFKEIARRQKKRCGARHMCRC